MPKAGKSTSTSRTSKSVADVDAYIAAAPPAVQPQLRKLRAMIRAEAPQATEKISYGIPTFALEGNLVHFAAFNWVLSDSFSDCGIQQGIIFVQMLERRRPISIRRAASAHSGEPHGEVSGEAEDDEGAKGLAVD